MKTLWIAAVLSLAGSGVAHAQSTQSLFDEHKTSIRVSFPSNPIRFDKESIQYRTRLRQAYSARVNFAGRYVVVSWGCGTGCLAGGIVDKVSGRARLLPWSIQYCCYDEENDISPPDNLELIQVRADSKLIILNGVLMEEGTLGRHLFTFDGISFKPIRIIPDNGGFKEAVGFGPFDGR